jgi:hypothetical protein
MERFNQLVGEQLKIMDRLLYIQAEIEKHQQLEKEGQIINDESNVKNVQYKLVTMQRELREVQQQFEKQTKEVILSFNEDAAKEIHA